MSHVYSPVRNEDGVSLNEEDTTISPVEISPIKESTSTTVRRSSGEHSQEMPEKTAGSSEGSVKSVYPFSLNIIHYDLILCREGLACLGEILIDSALQMSTIFTTQPILSSAKKARKRSAGILTRTNNYGSCSCMASGNGF
jgi:hypothetical protein